MVGSGTAQDPFQVATVDDLEKVGTGVDGWDSDAYYVQVADIDFADKYDKDDDWSDWNGGAGWEPINNFTGSYDGQGCRIKHLITYPAGGGGLFSYIYGNATVKNVGLEDCFVRDEGDRYFIAGLVGDNSGLISCCYSKGTIEGWMYIGGLVGWNDGTVRNCYSAGMVKGMAVIGGLIGARGEGDIDRCYSTTLVDAMFEPKGGLIAENYGSAVTTSFYDTETSGCTDTGKGTPLTTAQMQNIQTYLTAGWDICEKAEFDPAAPTTWFIDDGKDYPRLGWEYEPPPPPPVFAEQVNGKIKLTWKYERM